MIDLEFLITKHFGIAEELSGKVTPLFSMVELEKGDFFLRSGTRCDKLGFLRSGIIREFVNLDGKEITKWISTSGYFIVDLASFNFDIPARWNFQALTPCELYVIEKSQYQTFSDLIPDWHVLENRFITKCFIILEDRVMSHLSLSAEERYHRFLDFNSDLFNQVPLQYIASMLGMTPETFSRIRKRATP
jgi:CRP-like cAMP-binding protein